MCKLVLIERMLWERSREFATDYHYVALNKIELCWYATGRRLEIPKAFCTYIPFVPLA